MNAARTTATKQTATSISTSHDLVSMVKSIARPAGARHGVKPARKSNRGRTVPAAPSHRPVKRSAENGSAGLIACVQMGGVSTGTHRTLSVRRSWMLRHHCGLGARPTTVGPVCFLPVSCWWRTRFHFLSGPSKPEKQILRAGAIE